MEVRVERLVEEIKGLDEKGEVVALDNREITMRKEKFEELWRILKAKDVSIMQRSRNTWLREGDTNSKFFHKSVKLRASRNAIKALRVNDGWVVSPFEICKALVEYFTTQVLVPREEQPRLNGVPFYKLSGEERDLLVVHFSLEEIESCG
jgi:hypothetical protein